jgi:hypothetical protein
LVALFKEIKNYRFYWKKITAMQESGELAKRGLRADLIKRIYFVKNIEPEALLYGESEEGGVEQFEKQFVSDAIRVHNGIFLNDGSIELVKAEKQRIQTKDYYAYLIWIGFRFKKISFWNLVYVVLYILVAIWLVSHAIGAYPHVLEYVQGLLKIHVTK